MAKVHETRDAVHSLVHRSQMFHCSTATCDVADSASIGILISTGASDVHATWNVNAGGNSRVYLYANVTLGAAPASTGACAWSMNQDDKGSHGASLGVGSLKFDNTTGSILVSEWIPGGVGRFAAGGGARAETEWILAENTNYVLAACNRSGGAVGMSLSVEFYEH